MKYLKFLSGFVILTLITSCAATVRTTHSSSHQATPSSVPIVVYGLNENPPSNARNIGTIKIGDSGFSVDCGWNTVLEKAKNESRKIGGNAIKLLSVHMPDGLSTCYRLTAYALRGPEKKFLSEAETNTGFTENKLKTEWASKGVDDIEGIYEKIADGQSAKYTLAIKKKDNLEYQAIYLNGALEQFSHNWDEGDLKAKIIKTATPNFYKVEWYLADKSINSNLYISFDKGLMKTIWTENGMEEAYLKLYPTSESVLKSLNPNIVSSGTGFAINNQGYILTNNHVVENSKEVFVKGFNSDFNKQYKAEIVLRDKNNDLALLRIVDEDLDSFANPPYTFKRSLSEVGESVFALGYPLRATMGDEIKLTNGIISSKSGFQGDITNYQISVPVQPGNSGGPLLDNQGNIIGVISAKHIGAENASYAVKIIYLMNMLESSGEKIELNNTNMIYNQNLPNQVKQIRSFVYIIECK
jgi:V8-like Glu-specific endopeptidase